MNYFAVNIRFRMVYEGVRVTLPTRPPEVACQLSETWLRRPNHQAMKINGAKTNVISRVTAEALLMLPLYQ